MRKINGVFAILFAILIAILIVFNIYRKCEYDAGVEAYHRGEAYEKQGDSTRARREFEEAFNRLKPFAMQSQVNRFELQDRRRRANAQNFLGWMYENGRGVERNFSVAYQWYWAAKENGDKEYAPENLRNLYNAGIKAYERGKDYEEQGDSTRARREFEEAFNRLKPFAMQSQVNRFELQDRRRRANAQNFLGWMYENGRGVESHVLRAYSWYYIAEENGDKEYAPTNRQSLWKRITAVEKAYARTQLGLMYENGRGVERSFLRAYSWYYIAEENGDKEYAPKKREDLWKKMTPVEKERAKHWENEKWEDEQKRRKHAEKEEAERRKREREAAQFGIDAYEQGDIVKAFNIFKPLLKKENPYAQTFVDSIVQYIDTLGDHAAAVTSVAFSPDGKTLASGSEDKTIRLWTDIVANRNKKKRRTAHTAGVTSVAFSSDGKSLVSGSKDKMIKLWNTSSMSVFFPLRTSAAVTSVAFSPDIKYVAFGSEKWIRLLGQNKNAGDLLGEIKNLLSVTSVAFSPADRDRKNILAVGSKNNIRLIINPEFSEETISYIPQPPLEGHDGSVTSVAFSPDGKTLASGSEDKTIRVWDVDSKSQYKLLAGHDGSVTSVAFSPDGKYLASGSKDNTIRIWDVASESEIISLSEHTAAVTSVAFSPDRDSKLLASGSEDNTIRLWKILFLSQPKQSPRLSIVAVDFSSDFGKVLNAEETATLKIRIKNDGTADASNLKVELSSNLQGLSFPPSTDVYQTIPKGGVESVSITIHGKPDLLTAEPAWLNISVIDPKFEQQQDTTKYFDTLASNDIDVRKDIPETRTKNPTAVAVVIGNRYYTHPGVPSVDYAHNDAEIVKKYLIHTLGYKETNILYHKDATKGVFDKVFGTSNNHRGTLFNRVSTDGSSDIFIYYSGHGAPDVGSKLDEKPAYLVPVDANPSNVAFGGYKLDWLYKNLKNTPYRHATVVIDACFSGMSAKGSVIPNISGLGLPVDEFPSLSQKKSAVFTAVNEQQVANWYNDKQHGLFTYFFLRALSGAADDGDGQLTASEISAYVDEHVSNTARRHHNRDQNPQFDGNKNTVLVRY